MNRNSLILSIFPGIDLFGRAFEEIGFCVVRGPDLITAGDIRNFSPPKGRFDAVIGGPPCQDFSRLNRNPSRYSYEMLNEYCRIVQESAPEWFLFENVATVPHFSIDGYVQQRFELDLSWFSPFSRRRIFIFGSSRVHGGSGKLLNPIVEVSKETEGGCVTGSDERSFSACCEIQGLPVDFDLPFFTLQGKKQAVANAVPLQMGRYVAELIVRDFYAGEGRAAGRSHPPRRDSPRDRSEIRSVPLPRQGTAPRRCKCKCGRIVVGKSLHASAACRKRAQRARAK